MPKKLEDIKTALVREGHDEESAYKMATSQYKKMRSNGKQMLAGKKKPGSIADLRAMVHMADEGDTTVSGEV